MTDILKPVCKENEGISYGSKFKNFILQDVQYESLESLYHRKHFVPR